MRPSRPAGHLSLTLAAATALVALALVAPAAAAFPAANTGRQSGVQWGEATLLPAQGGTGFLLAGAVGDHDVRFLDASGLVVGESRACGMDRGIVPAAATLAEIRVWDHAGALVPKCVLPLALPVGSRFVYVDGL